MNICRSKDGFIKLHYKIQESDLWQDHTGLLVFLRLISYAHYKDNYTSVRFHGKQRYLKRGEFSATFAELSDELHMPMGTLRKVIRRLTESGRIATIADNRTTIFSICNYARYQGFEDNQRGKQQDNQADNQQDKRNRGLKEVKEVKEVKDISSTRVDMKDVFYQLVTSLGFTDSVQFTDQRKTKLKLRLKRYTVEQLDTVAKQIYQSPWHQGENPNGARYGTIDFLLRSDEKIDEWLNAKQQQVTYKADW